MAEPLPISRAYPAPGIVVERREKSIAISGTMEMYGPEANAQRAASVEMNINRAWTKSFPDGFSVTCHIHVRLRGSGAPSMPAAEIEADKLWGPSHVSRSFGVGARSMSLNANEPDAFTWTPAHEFGHIIGLDDRYTESIASQIRGSVGGRRTTTPNPGYESNLMAITGGILQSKNLGDLASETAPSPYWINDDTEVRNWLSANADSEVGKISIESKIKAIKTLMGGYVSDADIAAIVRICNSASSRAEADALRNAIDPLGFSSIRQRTEMRVVLARMKYQVFKGEPAVAEVYHRIHSLVVPNANTNTGATVAPGDSLSGLAAKYYGAEEYWPLIWDANRATIGHNPNLIKPGAVLQIPPKSGLSAAQRENAKRVRAAWKHAGHRQKQHTVPVAPLR